MKTAQEILRQIFPPPTNEAERNDDENIIKAMELYASQMSAAAQGDGKDADNETELDYKYINYTRNEDGIDIWIGDNAPVHLEDCYELSRLAEQLNVLNKKIWDEPF